MYIYICPHTGLTHCDLDKYIYIYPHIGLIHCDWRRNLSGGFRIILTRVESLEREI